MGLEQINSLRVVVLAGSAGSLDALGTVLGALPGEPGFAVLVITHLDPREESRLAELLAPRSSLPVERLEHMRAIEHDRVFVLPENAGVVALDGHFRLVRRAPGTLHLPIDACLASLAQDPDVEAAAVILSGAGQDGAAGIVDLKAAGGLVIAQSPASTEHPGMPTAAIDTGLVDEVLAPAEIAAALLRRFGADTAPAGTIGADIDALSAALAIVQQKTGVNLGYVKDVNLRRRFLRRVLLQKNRDVAAYLQLLRADAAEAAALRDDILIGVTAFFRDIEFVNVLRQTVIPKLLELRHDPIRIWVPACSTGEEVYTIAMLLKEALATEGLNRRVQIFGTDLNESAIETARAGRYPAAALENVPIPFREHAFVATASGYLVAKDIREMCVFAHHNLLTHAPFSGMGLISCRNMLIYLRKEAQQHVFEVLHYACRPDGFMIVGRAEAASNADGFEHAGAPHLYRKLPLAKRQRPLFPIDALRPWASDSTVPRPRPAEQPDRISEAANRCALERYAPPGFVVDENGDVVQFRGDVAAFVAPASGEATLALPRLLNEELNVPVRTALIEAKRMGAPVRRERVSCRDRRYALEVLPINPPDAVPHYLVTLALQPDDEPLAAGAPAHAQPRMRVEELERTVATLSDELEATQAQLKTLVGEFESANEELRTSNEEMLSTNEELQSANEELQSAKQELESANQELQSLNEELNSRNDKLDQANDDLSNLVEGIPLPVVLVDRQLRLRHASPQAAALFDIGADSIGRALAEVGGSFPIADLERLVQAAVHDLAAVEQEHADAEGRWWLVHVRAYRTADDRIDGAVIAFQDIDALKRAVDEAHLARREAESANQAKDDFLGLVSHELRAPLNVISSWTAVLRQEPTLASASDAARRGVETILHYCQVQAQLIDDLLDVSRISSGRLTLELRTLDLGACVRSVVDGLMPSADERSVTLATSGLRLVQMVHGDARRLQQVIANLLGNALKFTPRGGRIEITLTRTGPMVELSVVDNGIGIDAELLPRLFDRFSQADMTRTREYGGLGLGLSIVRHLVRAHGGTVSAHSEGQGHGARFTVRFPSAGVVSREVQPPADDAHGSDDLAGLKVLIVDDDEAAVTAIEYLLKRAGADVQSANSAAEARLQLAVRGFDAVVSDVAMPVTDGYAFMRGVRGAERNGGEGRRMFTIALTGLASLQDRDAALAAGFDDHMAKPVNVERLVEKLLLAKGR